VAWWVALRPSARLWFFLVLAAAELTVPLWAESVSRTSWHPGHIAERFGLFTIIVLGETLLAPTVGVEDALNRHTTTGRLAPVVVGGLLIVFSMWWFYFDMPADRMVEQVRQAFSERLTGAFIWGYGHYIVFASAAATGAALIVAVDQAAHRSRLSDFQAGWALTVPVATYLVVVWALHFPYKRPGILRSTAVPVTATLILASVATPVPALATGCLLAVLVAASIVANRPRPAPTHQQLSRTPAE